MRLETIVKEILKISLAYGTAQRTDKGVTLTSTQLARSIALPSQTVNALILDSVILDAVSKMKKGTRFDVSVFHEICNTLERIKKETPQRRYIASKVALTDKGLQ